MFKHFGQFVIKFRVLIIIFWLAIVLASWFLAPSLSSSSSGGNDVFLPSNSESKQASQLLERYFAQEESSSISTLNIILFNESCLSDKDMIAAQNLQDWLLGTDAPSAVVYVQSIFNNPALSGRLLSPDGTTMLMNVSLDNSSQDIIDQAIRDIRAYGDANINAGPLEVYTSGMVAINYDMQRTLIESIDATTIATIVLVIVLLLLIYRSPLAVMMPLLTIGCAYIVSRGVLGILGQYVNIWSQLDVLVIVLVFGVGTDYCLFMISRYREELHKTKDVLEALKNMIRRIGVVITASALAVFAGLAVMGIARFQMLQTAGPSMSISIIITLLAAITLAPAVMSFFKRQLFWPSKIEVSSQDEKNNDAWRKNSVWDRVGTLATKYNFWVIVVICALLIVPVGVLYPHVKISYNSLEQLPKDSEAGKSFSILTDHFNVAEIFPSYAIIISQNSSLSSTESLNDLYNLTVQIKNLSGIGQVQSLLTPDGNNTVTPIMYASNQILLLASALQTDDNSIPLASLFVLQNYLGELQLAFPNSDLTEQEQLIDSILNLIQTKQVDQGIDLLMISLQNAASSFTQAGDPFFVSEVIKETNEDYESLLNVFLSADGQAMQFYILVNNHPFSQEAMDSLREARSILHSFAESNNAISSVAIGGNTPVQVDIQDAMNRDVIYIQVAMICCLFVILAVLLRSLLAPIYLLATVLLSYFTTMGLCSWIFVDLLGHDGIGFFMPIIVFVLLVALGSDYNMFLMSRVKEESEKHHIKLSVRRAVAMTGGIISACGLILGGTFAALTISPILMLLQIGVAVAVGVFLDTFIIRPLLVPAITSLIGRYTWWPFGHKQIEKHEKELIDA